MNPQPELNGYAFIFRYNKAKYLSSIFTNSEKCSLVAVKNIPDHRWELEIVSADDWVDTKFIGVRMIDDVLVNVWLSYSKKSYLAQNKV